jgi:hypothetical protein
MRYCTLDGQVLVYLWSQTVEFITKHYAISWLCSGICLPGDSWLWPGCYLPRDNQRIFAYFIFGTWHLAAFGLILFTTWQSANQLTVAWFTFTTWQSADWPRIYLPQDNQLTVSCYFFPRQSADLTLFLFPRGNQLIVPWYFWPRNQLTVSCCLFTLWHSVNCGLVFLFTT